MRLTVQFYPNSSVLAFCVFRADISGVNFRPASPLFAWTLLVAGILATALAWQDRQPATTADFTLFYRSAQASPPQMYAPPPGPPRGNMNPPLFQLLLKPLTAFPLPTAATIFRVLNVISLCACLWWLARTSEEPWDVGDIGAVLAWAPMASVISLNQLTWILWPPLLWAWWCWRQDRWVAGAIGYGLALGLKPFLGVFLLWLVVTRRWRAAAVSIGSAALSFAIGLAVYGIDVSLAWAQALADVTWAHALMNASLEGLLARTMSKSVFASSPPLVDLPALVGPLALAGGALIVGVTLLHTRRQHVDQSWLPLMSSALLASPLGWLYYIWWVLPGNRPSRLLLESPLLWVPMVITVAIAPSRLRTLTLGSIYFWGLFTLWIRWVLRSYRTSLSQ